MIRAKPDCPIGRFPQLSTAARAERRETALNRRSRALSLAEAKQLACPVCPPPDSGHTGALAAGIEMVVATIEESSAREPLCRFAGSRRSARCESESHRNYLRTPYATRVASWR